jgi:hypothetical protein
MGPFDGEDAANFWNPKIRGPVCYNPPAARSILPMTYKRTEMVLAGQSKAQIIDGIKTFIKQELPPLEPGAMSYMMSKEQYLTDDGHHNWMAHLMFYTPLMDGAVWGADLPNSPVMLNPQFNGAPEPIDVFMVPAGWWSDGTADPVIPILGTNPIEIETIRAGCALSKWVESDRERVPKELFYVAPDSSVMSMEMSGSNGVGIRDSGP